MHSSLNIKRRVLLASVLASFLVVGCGGGGSSSSQIRPTKAMYDQINVGMSYTQVVSIVGGSGDRGTGGFGGEAIKLHGQLLTLMPDWSCICKMKK